MRIEKIELKNFKRFTDLTISEIPETAKLVLLIGSNGSGKSSIFDAFNWLSIGSFKSNPYNSNIYYLKDQNIEGSVIVNFQDNNLISKTSALYSTANPIPQSQLARRFIGRSSNRIIPKIQNENSNPFDIKNDFDSPLTYIENDTRFINDVLQFIQNINNGLRDPVFKGIQADTLKIFKDFIDPFNMSLQNIFGFSENTTIQLAEFQDATQNEAAKLIFKKGNSKINYDLLSHGEKQVVILLINFIVRQEYYKDCIIFIDEIDCHLNTAIQTNLINEIVTRWIPDDSQLWTASHALGFIDFARKSENASTIDFDLLNFDSKQELVPVSKEKLDVYEIAIPKATITSILKGYKLVVAENKNATYYNLALGSENFLFLPADNSIELFQTIKGDSNKIGIRDKDYLRPDEIIEIKSKFPNFYTTKYYTFENYLYHPENLKELKLVNFEFEEYVNEIRTQKENKYDDIISEIGTSRQTYLEFKNGIKNDGKIREIIDLLKSNDFEKFYIYFNMKNHFNKKYLNRFKYTTEDLVKTNWFKQEILKVLQN